MLVCKLYRYRYQYVAADCVTLLGGGFRHYREKDIIYSKGIMLHLIHDKSEEAVFARPEKQKNKGQ